VTAGASAEPDDTSKHEEEKWTTTPQDGWPTSAARRSWPMLSRTGRTERGGQRPARPEQIARDRRAVDSVGSPASLARDRGTRAVDAAFQHEEQ
jgi:hypothetical protein